MMTVKEARIHIQLLRLKGQILEMRCGLCEIETRINNNHDPKTGRFTSGKGVDNITESGIIEPSATGANELKIKGFKNKQKLNNHWKNGRTHQKEYIPDGIITAEQYEKRAVELLESPVGGAILGHIDKSGTIIRYDTKK